MMNRYMSPIYALLFLIGGAGFASGWNTSGKTLSPGHGVSLHILESSGTSFVTSADLRAKDTTFVVSGAVEKKTAAARIRGHVDIRVMDPAGNMIAGKNAPLLPANPHPNVRSRHFSALLDTVPPPGSVVMVSVHHD